MIRRSLLAAAFAGYAATAVADEALHPGHSDYRKFELGCAIFATDTEDCTRMVRDLEEIDLSIPWDVVKVSVETPMIVDYLDHLRAFATKYYRVWQFHNEEDAESRES